MYLMTVRRLERRIVRLTIQHDELQTCLLPSAVRYDKDIVQTSPEDKMSDVASAVLDLEKKIKVAKIQKADAIIQISKAIAVLPDDRERDILTAYYIGRSQMEQIASEVGYSLSHTYALRRKGVKYLSELLLKK